MTCAIEGRVVSTLWDIPVMANASDNFIGLWNRLKPVSLEHINLQTTAPYKDLSTLNNSLSKFPESWELKAHHRRIRYERMLVVLPLPARQHGTNLNRRGVDGYVHNHIK